MLDEVSEHFHHLAKIRNKAIHFRPDVDHSAPELALEAIITLSNIIDKQFGYMGGQPWIIPNSKGVFFIRKDWEEVPFVKRVLLPNCALVGPYHGLENTSIPGVWEVIDPYQYDVKSISDEEFWELYSAHQEGAGAL